MGQQYVVLVQTTMASRISIGRIETYGPMTEAEAEKFYERQAFPATILPLRQDWKEEA